MSGTGSTPLGYFDAMYRERDPWGYETSWYEQRKYALTLAALTRRRYGRAFEAGCSIGVLTERLAGRCDHLLAVDWHGAALDRARERLRAAAGVEVARLDLARAWPPGPFDLVVLSEVAYYFDVTALTRLVDDVAGSLADGGELVLVHWTGETDYPQTGDGAHRAFTDDPRLTVVVTHREDEFRLDVCRPTAR